MRAIQIKSFGGPDVLESIERTTPTPGEGEILVRLRAIGVNFAETLARQAKYVVTPELPAVLGSEGAGEIAALGPRVSGLSIGQRVAAPLFAAGSITGAYAEYAVLPAALAVPLPDDISFEIAAAVQVQGLTALYLIRQADPKGKNILINAAAGGVGSLLVQMAGKAGAKTIVAAASSHEKLEFAKKRGADAGVNYTKADWLDELRRATGSAGPDVIYESVGGKVLADSLAALAPLGRIVIYGALNIHSFALGAPELLGMIFKNQSMTGFAFAPLLTPQALGRDLRHLFDLIAAGGLDVNIGGAFPLERAAEAHRALENRTTMGKLLLLA
ncbi:zinc-binding dehydrogenase [Rhodoblastus sp. 17X3]|uniref:quinone oxidoreductase family protein n=1 Tax=Rhodoblastus sp. 17X3 TaxID=3047026 RepID=UPI0024B6FC92|nr:zinc-binding dehydrogenase [Rhodoblastus sp. 17X3]MDI9848885.1 zinc-binding dehydrogenase [Rhodoblastus sp. 17X3]